MLQGLFEQEGQEFIVVEVLVGIEEAQGPVEADEIEEPLPGLGFFPGSVRLTPAAINVPSSFIMGIDNIGIPIRHRPMDTPVVATQDFRRVKPGHDVHVDLHRIRLDDVGRLTVGR